MFARNIPEHLKNQHMHGGFTHAQMEEIRQRQINGDVTKVPANRAASISDQFFAREYTGYQIPDHEAGNYHVAMESRLFSPATGERKSTSRVQIFDPETFAALIENNGFHGYITHILHDPSIQ